MKPTPEFLIATYPGRQWFLPAGGDISDIQWSDGTAPTDIADKLAAYSPSTVPVVVSRFQARMALHNAGLFDQVDAAMALSTTPVIAKEAWGSAQEFRRDSQTVASMGASLGMTDSQLDDLFTAAALVVG
jgi:hypothetical protein